MVSIQPGWIRSPGALQSGPPAQHRATLGWFSPLLSRAALPGKAPSLGCGLGSPGWLVAAGESEPAVHVAGRRFGQLLREKVRVQELGALLGPGSWKTRVPAQCLSGVNGASSWSPLKERGALLTGQHKPNYTNKPKLGPTSLLFL